MSYIFLYIWVIFYHSFLMIEKKKKFNQFSTLLYFYLFFYANPFTTKNVAYLSFFSSCLLSYVTITILIVILNGEYFLFSPFLFSFSFFTSLSFSFSSFLFSPFSLLLLFFFSSFFFFYVTEGCNIRVKIVCLLSTK